MCLAASSFIRHPNQDRTGDLYGCWLLPLAAARCGLLRSPGPIVLGQALTLIEKRKLADALEEETYESGEVAWLGLT